MKTAKKFILYTAVILILAMAFTGCAAKLQTNAQTTPTPQQTTSIVTNTGTDTDKTRNILSVSDSGEVYVDPDVAYITIGVYTRDISAKAAQQANATAMEKVVASIKANGIEDKNLTTIRYSVSPIYDYSTQKAVITGYDVTNSVRVKIKDLKIVGKIIDDTSAAGANQIESISFNREDYKAAYLNALDLAIKNAVAKADAMGASAGIKISGPIGITESGSSSTPNYSYPEFSGGKDASSTPVSQGQIKITASVAIQYEIVK